MKMTKLSSKLILTGLVIVISTFFLWMNKKPNIILFSADTLRADHLSCYGYFRKTSPNIDAFAKDSVLFKNAISQAPSTTQAYMSIFTSLTPPVHLCELNPESRSKGTFLRLDESIETLPLLLKKNGYLTLGFHGGGQMTEELGFGKGFDSYRLWGANIQNLENELEDVREAIQESKREKKPFFLFLHNYICHASYLRSPPEFNRKFLSERVAGLPISINDLQEKNFSSSSVEAFWKNVDLSNPEHRKHIVSLYDGSVSYEDHLFGRLVEILKKEKLYDNSIIIFFSDHGEEFYEHLGKEHGKLFIEQLHVPLIIKFPGNRFGGRVISEWVRTMDIMPALFDFLNIKIKNTIQGISFGSLITGSGVYSPLIVSYVPQPSSYAVRFIKEPFVYSNQDIGTTKEWLFDITKDPQEKNNLAVKNAGVTEQMRSVAREIEAENKAVREKIDSEPTAVLVSKGEKLFSQLKSLGYLQ